MLEPVWDTGGKRLEMVIVSRIEEGGVADRCGVWEGDEVMRVNGRPVREAGWVGTRSSLDGMPNQIYVKTQNFHIDFLMVTINFNMKHNFFEQWIKDLYSQLQVSL